MQDEFEKVGGFEKMWNAVQTGSKAKNNRVELPATDKSWIMGWYTGSREAVINGDVNIVHKIKAVAFGDPAHSEPIVDTENGEFREFFGTTVLNDTLSQIRPGQFIRILYLGNQTPKKAGGRNYKGWEVGKSTTRPMLTNFGVQSPIPDAIKKDNATASNNNAETFVAEGDDDLPF